MILLYRDKIRFEFATDMHSLYLLQLNIVLKCVGNLNETGIQDTDIDHYLVDYF